LKLTFIDLTILFLTANKVPKEWAKYHLDTLKKATKGVEKITLCRNPVDYGLNDFKVSSEGVANIYHKILRGAELASTEYVAVVEDDTLYHSSHFTYRPKELAYNMNRWMMFTWGDSFYFYKPRYTNATLIAKRDVVIDCLRKRIENRGVALRGSGRKEISSILGEPTPEEFYSRYPVVGLSHVYAIDELEQRQNKKAWPVHAYDIPYWGHANNMREKFK